MLIGLLYYYSASIEKWCMMVRHPGRKSSQRAVGHCAAGFSITGQSFTALCTENCVFQVVFPGKSSQL
jgi:hypothetical protein